MTESQLVQQIRDCLHGLGYAVAVTGQGIARSSGSTEGFPDMAVRRSTWPVGTWFLLEVKTPKGRVSRAQKELADAGGSFIVWSLTEALEKVRDHERETQHPGNLRCEVRLNRMIEQFAPAEAPPRTAGREGGRDERDRYPLDSSYRRRFGPARLRRHAGFRRAGVARDRARETLMDDATHTPGQWLFCWDYDEAEGYWICADTGGGYDAGYQPVAVATRQCFEGEEPLDIGTVGANARRIVHCVNHFDQTREALANLVDAVRHGNPAMVAMALGLADLAIAAETAARPIVKPVGYMGGEWDR